MKVKTLAPLLILICAASVFGQEQKCTLKLSDLPESAEVFGFRTGMTTDQVKTRVPLIIIPRANAFGVALSSVSPDFDPKFDKAAFAGVRTISFDFLDGRITSIWIGYDGTFKWQTVPEFVKGISQSLRLPDAWASWKGRGQRMVCSDFQVAVTMLGEGPSFRINDSNAEELIAARRQAQEESEASASEAKPEIIADKLEKIYYTEGCQPAAVIKDLDRIVFQSVEEAEKAGYKPAKHCQ